MPYLETPTELAEHIADLVGVYGCGTTDDDETGDDHPESCRCRICFVWDIESRIKQAAFNEKVLNAGNKRHRIDMKEDINFEFIAFKVKMRFPVGTIFHISKLRDAIDQLMSGDDFNGIKNILLDLKIIKEEIPDYFESC